MPLQFCTATWASQRSRHVISPSFRVAFPRNTLQCMLIHVFSVEINCNRFTGDLSRLNFSMGPQHSTKLGSQIRLSCYNGHTLPTGDTQAFLTCEFPASSALSAQWIPDDQVLSGCRPRQDGTLLLGGSDDQPRSNDGKTEVIPNSNDEDTQTREVEADATDKHRDSAVSSTSVSEEGHGPVRIHDEKDATDLGGPLLGVGTKSTFAKKGVWKLSRDVHFSHCTLWCSTSFVFVLLFAR